MRKKKSPLPPRSLEKSNYSWKTTVVVPESAQFKPGPTDGKTEKDGFTHIKTSFRDNTIEVSPKAKRRLTSIKMGNGNWPTDRRRRRSGRVHAQRPTARRASC
jgi:hypothetical protein